MAFEGVLGQEKLIPKRWRRTMVTFSISLHVAALIVGVAYSMWQVDELPLPALAVTLAASAPPPPPPPPPAARKKTTKPKTKPVEIKQPQALVQPTETPKELPKEEPPEDDDEGVEGGVPGGVKGGVVGGVVGGVPAPPPPKPTGPVMLSNQIARALLLIDPNADEYKVRLPPPLKRSGQQFFAVVKICVSVQGTVYDVKLLKGADPAIDVQIPNVIRKWRYRPFTRDGKPGTFCYLARYEID